MPGASSSAIPGVGCVMIPFSFSGLRLDYCTMSYFWPKAYVPKSLFGRAALILLVPVVTIQLVVGVVFIQRHYENVTRQMTSNLLLEVRYMNELIANAETVGEARAALAPIGEMLEMDVDFTAEAPSQTQHRWYDLSGIALIETMASGLPELTGVDLTSHRKRVVVGLDSKLGPVLVDFSRIRVAARNPHQLLVLMVVASFLLTVIAFVFLKNQVRPIRRLSEAATAFGRGRAMDYRPSGATEVRAAGSAFLDMRNRIERHMEQRTLMLSGVSHDLRTPLTRLKLSLSMMEDGEERDALLNDVSDMENMIETFLAFSRSDATEAKEAVDAVQFATDAVNRARRGGGDVMIAETEGAGDVTMRALSVQRALDNLISNALRYGKKAAVSVLVKDGSVRFSVEDDGPGIAEDMREEALRPFTRLDTARNQNRGSGVGLGLAIASDIARQHGGILRLGQSGRLGGLQVDLVLSR